MARFIITFTAWLCGHLASKNAQADMNATFSGAEQTNENARTRSGCVAAHSSRRRANRRSAVCLYEQRMARFLNAGRLIKRRAIVARSSLICCARDFCTSGKTFPTKHGTYALRSRRRASLRYTVTYLRWHAAGGAF